MTKTIDDVVAALDRIEERLSSFERVLCGWGERQGSAVRHHPGLLEREVEKVTTRLDIIEAEMRRVTDKMAGD